MGESELFASLGSTATDRPKHRVRSGITAADELGERTISRCCGLGSGVRNRRHSPKVKT